MHELKIQQASDKRHSQGLWVDTGFVFTDKYGKNMSLYAPTRICSEVQAKYGLRHLKLHGLRHTCGSLMVEHGVDPETVKTVLGHESLKTTNRYLHPYPIRYSNEIIVVSAFFDVSHNSLLKIEFLSSSTPLHNFRGF